MIMSSIKPVARKITDAIARMVDAISRGTIEMRDVLIYSTRTGMNKPIAAAISTAEQIPKNAIGL